MSEPASPTPEPTSVPPKHHGLARLRPLRRFQQGLGLGVRRELGADPVLAAQRQRGLLATPRRAAQDAGRVGQLSVQPCRHAGRVALATRREGTGEVVPAWSGFLGLGMAPENQVHGEPSWPLRPTVPRAAWRTMSASWAPWLSVRSAPAPPIHSAVSTGSPSRRS